VGDEKELARSISGRIEVRKVDDVDNVDRRMEGRIFDLSIRYCRKLTNDEQTSDSRSTK
jgi:hypothetical protein